MIYFEMCQEIWGGFPATKQLDGGIESVDMSETRPDESPKGSPDTQLEDESTSASDQPFPPEDTSASTTRRLLNATLKNYKQGANFLFCLVPKKNMGLSEGSWRGWSRWISSMATT